MKKILKFAGYTLLSIIAFLGIYFMAVWGLSRVTVDREPKSKEEVTIYIKTNGVHTDIVVPVRTDQMDWSQEIKYSNTKSQDSNFHYLSMGWGDKGFYLETPAWKDLKFSVAFKAVFGLSTTAIHATYYDAMVENETCRKINISREQYSRLINYITSSLQKDNQGHFINIKTNANYSNTDAFYEAVGSYSLFHTCNTWANKGLKCSGQKCCLWTIFDTGIFSKYQDNSKNGRNIADK